MLDFFIDFLRWVVSIGLIVGFFLIGIVLAILPYVAAVVVAIWLLHHYRVF